MSSIQQNHLEEKDLVDCIQRSFRFKIYQHKTFQYIIVKH